MPALYNPNRIVICGSISHYPSLVECGFRVAALGFLAVLPPSDDEFLARAGMTPNDLKKSLSLKHFDEITNSETSAILVVNNPKRGLENYIGPNAFAEVAVAVSARKAVFLLHEIFEPYEEELIAWGAVPLGGQIDGLAKHIERQS